MARIVGKVVVEQPEAKIDEIKPETPEKVTQNGTGEKHAETAEEAAKKGRKTTKKG